MLALVNGTAIALANKLINFIGIGFYRFDHEKVQFYCGKNKNNLTGCFINRIKIKSRNKPINFHSQYKIA
jgi:hypothetical protein